MTGSPDQARKASTRKARGRGRANGEGSIFPYRNGYAAYVWVTTPDCKRTRKWAYGKTRDETHEKWLKLHDAARKGPVATKSPTLGDYLADWLREVVVPPNFAPLTCSTYETLTRLYIVPGLGKKRLDKLTVRDVRAWLNELRETCQCCAQGKDARRDEKRRRCCAKGQCCKQYASERTIRDAWTVLRSALTNAVTEELIPKNVAGLVRVAKPRVRKNKPWSVDEARRFLESARNDGDPMYAAYVLILILGLRKGEVLGLPWDAVDLDAGEIDVAWQLQRVRRELLHRETKTEASDATLPLPGICATALVLRQKRQEQSKEAVGDDWTETGLVFTTRYGTPIDPRNFNRSFDERCAKAGVRRIKVHDTRHTCATLLAALDVHPRVAMRILRHAQIDVTMEVYTEVSDAKTLKALKRLGRQFDV
ncbi:tyrosine-type recombinase/integrase [Actinomadura chibensis]|uniref:Site-specific integrase n=1 Tax=Actinomadura chibensis TaxID=392828 RepID=A0A5D0NXB2_9ACTN|nr:site-specific integrase [Actinomadura chibensis]TYB49186.1 site-specific integrase [Actinomadura chibensis]